jgi:hypothetical protein
MSSRLCRVWNCRFSSPGYVELSSPGYCCPGYGMPYHSLDNSLDLKARQQVLIKKNSRKIRQFSSRKLKIEMQKCIFPGNFPCFQNCFDWVIFCRWKFCQSKFCRSKFCRSKFCRSKFLSVKILVGQILVAQNSVAQNSVGQMYQNHRIDILHMSFAVFRTWNGILAFFAKLTLDISEFWVCSFVSGPQ